MILICILLSQVQYQLSCDVPVTCVFGLVVLKSLLETSLSKQK